MGNCCCKKKKEQGLLDSNDFEYSVLTFLETSRIRRMYYIQSVAIIENGRIVDLDMDRVIRHMIHNICIKYNEINDSKKRYFKDFFMKTLYFQLLEDPGFSHLMMKIVNLDLTFQYDRRNELIREIDIILMQYLRLPKVKLIK